MKKLLFLFLLSACCLISCKNDSADPEPGPCADTSRVYAFPTPAWQRSDKLAPPQGDLAVSLLTDQRPLWEPQLSGVDGWPIRPTIIVPLVGAATAVSLDKIHFYGSAANSSEFEEIEIAIDGSLANDSTSLILKPTDPFPPDIDEVILVVETGALAGSRALPACGPDSTPDPAYLTARQALPQELDIELALPFRLSSAATGLPALSRQLNASPVLTVSEIDSRALDSFGEFSPAPQVAALLNPIAAAGILELPDYRNPSGHMQHTSGQAPQVFGTTNPGFIVGLPAAGTAPFPFVLYQHGGGQNKALFFQLAGPLLEAGFAFVAMDLPFHGDRAGAGGGSDMDILDFDNPLGTRDNLRQASADHLAVLSGITALNQALNPIFGIDQALDSDQQYYMGLSMGGITGSMTFASSESLSAAALFVGGGGYAELVSSGVFSLMVYDLLQLEPMETTIIMSLLEVMMDGADPLAYSQRQENRSLPPVPVFFMQAIDDPIVIMESSDRWARAFGAELAKPFHHEVSGMQAIDLPQADNFSWPAAVGAAATRLLVQCPMAEVPIAERHGELIMQAYSQQMVAHCFESVLSSGSCEIIDTDFAQH